MVVSLVSARMQPCLTMKLADLFCVSFYINLPVGVFAMTLFVLFFKAPPQASPRKLPLKQLIINFDLPGVGLLLGSLTCLFLALEWGGVTKSWSTPDVIGCLVGFFVLAGVFVGLESHMGERALVVPRIFTHRTIFAVCMFIFFLNSAGFVRNYNLPIYFQSVDGVDPTESGIRVLPTILSLSLCTMVASGAVGKLGWIQPFLLVGAGLACIGGGLVYTFDVGTSVGKFIGFQIVAGVGMGLALQVPVITAQSISKFPDLAVSMASVLFFQFLAAAVGVSVGQSIFNNRLIEGVAKFVIPSNPSISPQEVLQIGAYGLGQAFPDPADYLHVRQAYVYGLKASWTFSIACAGVAFIFGALPHWRNIKTGPKI